MLVGQVTQLELDVPTEDSRNLPARQFVHVIVPLVGLYFPGTHAAHVHINHPADRMEFLNTMVSSLNTSVKV